MAVFWQPNGPRTAACPCAQASEVCGPGASREDGFIDRMKQCLPTLKLSSRRPFDICFFGAMRGPNRMSLARHLDTLQSTHPHLRINTSFNRGFATGLHHADYDSMLQQCAIGLAPCGNNPETHRLWEYMSYGVVAIQEYCADGIRRTPAGGASRHKFPPTARFQDHVNELAPGVLLTIEDWSQIESVITSLMGSDGRLSPEALDERQRKQTEWWWCYVKDFARRWATGMDTAFQKTDDGPPLLDHHFLPDHEHPPSSIHSPGLEGHDHSHDHDYDHRHNPRLRHPDHDHMHDHDHDMGRAHHHGHK